jgi:NAD(P)-dependent dehydrogenase (short-subunit alcohol dehydrogenase family)
MTLEGRLALVSGSSRGIGRAIALSLAEDGADVAVNYRRDEQAAAETVAAIEKLGRRATSFQASIGDREQMAAMVSSVQSALGDPDILVHNAGIASRGQTVEDTDPDELDRVMQVHALGPHFLTKLLIPGMKKKDRGDIVMISSVATLNHSGRGGPYNMGKAAMEALASTLSKELKPINVRVNTVAPGLVETEMGRRLIKARSGVENMRDLDSSMPFGRVCQPQDIANAVRFLVSEAASYISGEKINVHGGGSEGL